MSAEAAGINTASEALPAAHQMSDDAIIARAVEAMGDDASEDATDDGGEEAAPVTEAAPAEAAPAPEAKEPAPVETKAEGDKKTEAPAADPALEKSWSKLEKKEQQLWQRELQLKQTGEENKLLKEKLDKLTGSVESFDKTARSNPIRFMQERFGVTPRQLADALLAGGDIQPQQQPAQQQSNAELEAIKAQLEEMRRESTTARQEAYIAQYRGGVTQALGSEQFDLLRALPGGGADFVMTVASNLAANGEAVTPAEAAERALGIYREQLSTLKSNAAVRAFFTQADSGPTDSKQSSGESKKPQGRGATPRTLSNSLTARTPPQRIPDEEFLKMTEDEQIAAAARLIEDE